MTFRDVRRGFVLMDTGRKVKNLLAIEQMRNKRSSLGDKFAVNKIDTMKKSFRWEINTSEKSWKNIDFLKIK